MAFFIVAAVNAVWLLVVCVLMWLIGMKEATMYWLLFGGIAMVSLLAISLTRSFESIQAAGLIALLGFFIAGWTAHSCQKARASRFDEVTSSYLTMYDKLEQQSGAGPRIEGKLLVLDKEHECPDRNAFRHLPGAMLAYSPGEVRTVGVLDDGKVTLFTVREGKFEELLERDHRYSSFSYMEGTVRGGRLESFSTDATPLAVYPYLESLRSTSSATSSPWRWALWSVLWIAGCLGLILLSSPISLIRYACNPAYPDDNPAPVCRMEQAVATSILLYLGLIPFLGAFSRWQLLIPAVCLPMFLLADRWAFARFLQALKSPDADARAAAAARLGRQRDRRAIDALSALHADPNEVVRREAVAALARIKGEIGSSQQHERGSEEITRDPSADACVREPSANQDIEPDSAGTTQEIALPADQNRQEQILGTLRRFAATKGLFIAPNIPEKKLATALRQCQLPTDLPLLGLIDLTFWGSANDCIVFTSEAVHFCGTGDVQDPWVRGRLEYGSLGNTRLGNEQHLLCLDPAKPMNLYFSRCAAATVIRILHELGHVFAGPAFSSAERGSF